MIFDVSAIITKTNPGKYTYSVLVNNVKRKVTVDKITSNTRHEETKRAKLSHTDWVNETNLKVICFEI